MKRTKRKLCNKDFSSLANSYRLILGLVCNEKDQQIFAAKFCDSVDFRCTERSLHLYIVRKEIILCLCFNAAVFSAVRRTLSRCWKTKINRSCLHPAAERKQEFQLPICTYKKWLLGKPLPRNSFSAARRGRRFDYFPKSNANRLETENVH